MKTFERDKKLFKTVLLIALPIMVQNGFTNFVSLLDNIMVGRLGTESMSGVSIVNNLIFTISAYSEVFRARVFLRPSTLEKMMMRA